MTRLALFTLSLVVALLLGRFMPVVAGSDAPPVAAFLQQHFEERAAALYAGQVGPTLAAQVDTGAPGGRWLLAHEQQKAEHLQAWLRGRGYVLHHRHVEVKVLRVSTNGDTATAAVIFRLGLGYGLAGAKAGEVDQMGVGTSHVVQLARSGGSWLVQMDYALDPLYEEGAPPGTAPGVFQHSPPAAVAGLPQVGAAASPRDAPRFDRQQARAYADAFCGIAYGCGNGHRYNRLYRDYTPVGGDCANYASQVLAAGGLRPGRGWLYDAKRREASATWINAGSLVNHLLHSGTARLLASGTFAQVTRAGGGVGLPRLAPGDIIGYERDGDVVHVSVVAGADAHGYTVVNSHTADRHHVPWDLGWGEDTRFRLLQIQR